MNNRSRSSILLLLVSCLLFTSSSVSAQSKPASKKAAPKTAVAKAVAQPPVYSADDLKTLKLFTTNMQRELHTLAKSDTSNRPYTIEQALRAISGPKTPGSIFRWVVDNIGFEPYAGALRGSTGALVAGSANSVDQALLLNEMLQKSGFKTRFVQGTIQDHDLVQTLRSFTGSTHLTAPKNPGLLTEFAPEDYAERIQYTQLLANHVWLEVQQPDGQYLPADPVLAPLFGMTPAIAISRSDTLPAIFQANLELQLVARINDEQELTVLNIAGPLENYAYRTLSLGFTPDDVQKNGLRPTLKLDNRATVDRGELFPGNQLQNMEMRYTMKIGRRESRWTQTLYQSPSDKTSTERPDFSQQHFAISFIPGWTANDQLTRIAHQSLSQVTDQLNQLARKTPPADLPPEQSLHLALGELAPVIHFAYLRNLDRVTFELSNLTGVRPILQSPRVVTTAIARQNGELAITVNLQGDTLDSMPMAGVPPAAATGLLTIYGRIKNQLEGELMATASASKRTSIDNIFREARREKVPFTTLHSTRMDSIEQLQVNSKTRNELQELAINRGMILLLPTRPVLLDKVQHYGWWTLTPQTGALEGHHQSPLFSTQATAPVTISERLQSAINLSTHLHKIVQQTLDNSTPQQPLICKASKDVQRLSAGMCATTRSQKMPTLKECLKPKSISQNSIVTAEGLMSFATPGCEQQLKDTRCGVIVASALLNGTLALGAPEIPPTLDEQNTEQPLHENNTMSDADADKVVQTHDMQAQALTPYCP